MRHRDMFACLTPLLVIEAYLVLTFVLYLLLPIDGPDVSTAPVACFLLVAWSLFAAGYLLGERGTRARAWPSWTPLPQVRRIRLLLWLGAAHTLLFSIALFLEYGVHSPSQLLAAIASPSDAYFAKFDVYEKQQSTEGYTNFPIQVCTLTNLLSWFTIPLLVIYWGELGWRLRTVATCSVLSHALFFLSIGTMKGIGDSILVYGASLMIRRFGIRHRENAYGRTTKLAFAGLVLVLAFGAAYMAVNQRARLEHVSRADHYRSLLEDSWLATISDSDWSAALLAVAQYPCHGYHGLALNLAMPFEWTYGLGSSVVVRDYAGQYLGIRFDDRMTYPGRTEALTGWPAGLRWSTVFPWLASDLTYPGALLLTAGWGWWLARAWRAARLESSLIGAVLFTQLLVGLAYVPANNQLLSSRPSAWALMSCTILFVFRRRFGQLSGRRPPGATAL